MTELATYPLFANPKAYLRIRRGKFGSDWLKRWFEHRAIDRCLRGIEDVRTVCDAPCGPGRLFRYWRKKSMAVIGLDLSPPMVEAAKTAHRELNLQGIVLAGDAFSLSEHLKESGTPDLVASIRFCYYFQSDKRIELLRSLAEASRRYVLVQYKTMATMKGRRNLARSKWRKGTVRKYFSRHQEIGDEMREAGLNCLRIQPIGLASDRVFVLGERMSGKGNPFKGHESE